MTRWLIIGVMMLLLLWGLGGCWVLRQTEQRLEARAEEMLKGESAKFDSIKVHFSGQHAILEGKADSADIAKEAAEIIAGKLRLSDGPGRVHNPVRAVTSLIEIPSQATRSSVASGTKPEVGNTSPAAPVVRTQSWAMVCASGDKVRVAGIVSDVGTSAELASAVRRIWPGLKLTNMLRVEDNHAPFSKHGETMKNIPKPSAVGDDLIATSRGDGIWMLLPNSADELTVAQSLSGMDISISDLSNAMIGWRTIRPPEAKPVTTPPAPSPPPAPAVAASVASQPMMPVPVPAPDAPAPKPVAVAKALGPPYVGWAVSKDGVELFGSLLSESQKVKILEAAERLFQPKVVRVEHLQVDASRVDDGKSALALPSKLPAKPIGFLVAGAGEARGYEADVFDSEIVADHKGIGVRASEIAEALAGFRASMVAAGKVAAAEPYVRLASDGKTLVISGEVGDAAMRASLISAVKASNPALSVQDQLTVTPLVQVSGTLEAALRQAGKLETDKLSVLAVRAGQAVRRGLVHAIYFATGSNRSIDQDRAVSEVRRVLVQFPKARFEIVGHSDNVGKEDANVTLSLTRAKGFVDYLSKATGLDPADIAVRGAGPREPIAENATPKGRAMNRRVDVKILSYE